MVKVKEDLTGQTFWRLTVIKQVEDYVSPSGFHRAQWLCKCECGKEIVVRSNAFKTGNTKSCGCLSMDLKKQRLPNNRGVINQIILQYKRHARDRNLDWNLSYDDVVEIIQKPCFYCGTEKSNHFTTKHCKEGYDYNGIDRVDSRKGYEINNVVPCCKTCNVAKNNMNQKDFILWVHKVAQYTKRLLKECTQQNNLKEVV